METITLIKDYYGIIVEHPSAPTPDDPYATQPHYNATTYKAGQSLSGKWNYTRTHFMVDCGYDLTIPSEHIAPQPDAQPTIDFDTTEYKFAPQSPQESAQIQQILFEEGYSWSGEFTAQYTHFPYLYGKADKAISHGATPDTYNTHPATELTLQQLQQHKGIDMNPQHPLDKLTITDIPLFLKSGDRIFVVTTFDEAQEIRDLTMTALPTTWNTFEDFNRELDYFGGVDLAWKKTDGWQSAEYYRTEKDYKYLPQLTLSDVKYLLDIDESVPVTAEPAIERELWKNPKPSKKNTQPLKQGDYYVTEGCNIPMVAPADSMEIPIDGYPLHKLLPEQKPKVGDITEIDSQWTVVKDKEDIKQLKALTEDLNTSVNLWRITDENNKAIKVMNLNRYSCGTIIDNDSQEILPAIPTGVKVDTDYSYDFTWEHKQISSHFNVDMDSLHTQDELLHKQLSTTLDHKLNAARKEWAYIFGPSGSGKSTLAVDYANSISRPYILQQGTSQLTVDDLLGYKSITTGDYFQSLLRDAVENGKVFILDEADACNANTLLCLNALKHATFQFPDALVDIHPDFRLIMTANTCNDYSDDYSSRNPLDKATLDRCAIIEYNMKDYHLALRYGLEYIKQITDLDNKSPRQIEREITDMKINGLPTAPKRPTKTTVAYDDVVEDLLNCVA